MSNRNKCLLMSQRFFLALHYSCAEEAGDQDCEPSDARHSSQSISWSSPQLYQAPRDPHFLTRSLPRLEKLLEWGFPRMRKDLMCRQPPLDKLPYSVCCWAGYLRCRLQELVANKDIIIKIVARKIRRYSSNREAIQPTRNPCTKTTNIPT